MIRAFDDACGRLARHLGADDAAAVFDQAVVLARLGRAPETCEELLRVAVMVRELWPESGVVSATGSALVVTARLLGAVTPDR